MLTALENDLLCRVGGEASMDQLMRRHWIPAILSEPVAEPDGAPVRVRPLGVLRTHRKPSLVLERNEECGLRCLCHGWKFDVDGSVVKMPSEPEESGFAGKVKHEAYPAREVGGFVWVYVSPLGAMAAE